MVTPLQTVSAVLFIVTVVFRAHRVRQAANSFSPIPARMQNIQIVGNVIDHTARAGIQLSAAATGTNQVYQNKVTDSGWEHNQDQGRGITLGGVTHANVCGKLC